MAARLIVVPPECIDAEAGHARISGDAFHHVVRVLRLKPGAPIALVDGSGMRYEGAITQIGPRQAQVHLSSTTRLPAPPPPKLVLVIGLPRGARTELVLQKCTELGVDALLPVVCERSISRPSATQAKTDRWLEIVRQAARQSQRAHLPQLHPPTSLGQALPDGPRPGLIGLIASTDLDAPPLVQQEPRIRQDAKEIWLVVGPEGDFTAAEMDLALARGFAPIGLGPRILRTETAAVALLAIVAHLSGRLVG